MNPILRTSATVLLAHACGIWLIVHRLTTPMLSGIHEQVILASVVAEPPVQAAVRLAEARPAQHPPQHPAAQRTALTPASSTSPSESFLSTSATPASSSVAAAPATTGSAHPAPSAVVVLPSSDADYLNNPPPIYPRMSRRMGEQGTVLVRVFISTEGRAEKAEIRTSSGYARLDEAALETVQRWRFVPGKRAGQPEAMWFNVPIHFVLD